MKKKQTDVKKGERAEVRFISIARSLKSSVFVRSVRKASHHFDKHGIDVFVYVHSLHGKRDIKVPIQVKSSFYGVLDYHQKHPQCVEVGVVVIVVNDGFTDDQIREVLQKRLDAIQWMGKDYSDFYASLKQVDEHRSQCRHPSPLSHIEKLKYLRAIAHFSEKRIRCCDEW